MKRLTVFLLLVMLLAASLPFARAQDGAACSSDDVAAYLDRLDEASAAVRSALESGDDPAEALAALQEVTADYYALQATCAGLSFEGTGGKVLGPVEFPAGVYRATLNAGAAIVEIEPLDGDCDFTGFGGLATVSMSGPVDAEAVFKSSGCSALITVDQTLAGPWTLSFELIQ